MHTSLIFRLHETGAKLPCRSSISLSGGSRLAVPDGLCSMEMKALAVWHPDMHACKPCMKKKRENQEESKKGR